MSRATLLKFDSIRRRIPCEQSLFSLEKPASPRGRDSARRVEEEEHRSTFGASVKALLSAVCCGKGLWLRGDCVRARHNGDGTRFPVCGCIGRFPAILLRELLPFTAVGARKPQVSVLVARDRNIVCKHMNFVRSSKSYNLVVLP